MIIVETALSETTKPFMVFWQEWPSHRYVSLVIDILDNVDPEKFASDYLENYNGRVNFLGRSVPSEKYKWKEGFSLKLVEKIEPEKIFSWKIIWEDFGDGDITRISNLEIPVEVDPNKYAHDYLEDMLKEYSFSVCSIERV